MQCKQCGYRLWNIQSRQCPECGQAFVPSDFELVPGSVAFCCPHCDQTYFGTDEHGHLVPRGFDCIKCTEHIDMDQMVLRPAEGYKEQQTQQTENPWVARDKRKSTFATWLRACGRAMFNPSAMVVHGDRDRSFKAALGFLIFHNLMTLLLGIGVLVVIITMIDASSRGVDVIVKILTSLGMVIGGSICGILFVVLIWTAITHGILCLLGKPSGRFTDTFECLSFASGAAVLSAIPFCGIYGLTWVGAIWWPISAGIMLAKRHQMKTLRTMLAVWGLPLILIIALGGAIGYGIYISRQNMVNIMATRASCAIIGPKILQQVNDDQTIGPRHVGIYMVDTSMLGLEFQINDVSLDNWHGGFQEGFNELSSVFNQETKDIKHAHQKQLRATIEALPPQEGPGYRFGSMLFVYNKVTMGKLDPNLWLIIYWPRQSKPTQRLVYKADGTEERMSTEELLERLEEQNTLRRKLALPEIKSLDEIRIVPIPTVYTYGDHDKYPDQCNLASQILGIERNDGQIGPDHVLQLIVNETLSTTLLSLRWV